MRPQFLDKWKTTSIGLINGKRPQLRKYKTVYKFRNRILVISDLENLDLMANKSSATHLTTTKH